MLNIDETVMVLVDVQGKLARLMDGFDTLAANIEILLKSAKILEIPILWCEQNPQALGGTIDSLAEILQGQKPIEKLKFSCCTDEFMERLVVSGRRQVLLCGIESHICVCQSASELLRGDYEVFVIGDAVSSRTAENKLLALERMRDEGVKVYSTEMALFELLRTAKHEQFKEIARLVK